LSEDPRNAIEPRDSSRLRSASLKVGLGGSPLNWDSSSRAGKVVNLVFEMEAVRARRGRLVLGVLTMSMRSSKLGPLYFFSDFSSTGVPSSSAGSITDPRPAGVLTGFESQEEESEFGALLWSRDSIIASPSTLVMDERLLPLPDVVSSSPLTDPSEELELDATGCKRLALASLSARSRRLATAWSRD
jgi:hypothetical protein